MAVPLRYRVLLWLLSPFALLHTLYSAWRRGGGRRFVMQRFGFNVPAFKQQPIWCHAASVGEVNAVVLLIRRLMQENPAIPLLVTTNTANGAATVNSKLPQATHCYLPLDYRFSVQRFLKRVQPRCALIVETELWPNLYHASRQQRIPICLINARLSNKTLHAPNWLKPALRDCIANIDRILARGEQDRAGFIALGADAGKIDVIGNIKYARADSATTAALSVGRPYVLAASTHAGEETILLRIWKRLNTGNRMLIIAPRYPERRDEILRDIANAQLRCALRSRGDVVHTGTDVLLLDTLGELGGLFADAELVFMGGSLVPRGGQNVLEPAHHGKAIVTGPLTDTFIEEVSALKNANAIIQVTSETELQQCLDRLFNNPGEIGQLGDNARRFMQQQAGVIEKYLERIRIIIDT